MPIVKVEAETVQRVMLKVVGLGVIGTVNESFQAVLNGFARLSDEEAAEILGLELPVGSQTEAPVAHG